ncbi:MULTISPECIES: disulfide bond formation protein B [Microbulbifer]|uniref:disulfide bond formation protein B n=1 Tax=Microbulbifer TaxID=48073 RepID=UPI001E2D2C3F|nr:MULTISPECIES: disulfide bond formation protein B [Microbulbifer]UHQ53896.1 disulfide bond formation protein B [Microbulbifer sp. YPW16]
MPLVTRLGRCATCLDALGLLALAGVLWFAFAWQLLLHELPCPLCLLQRAAFAMAGVGLLLNLRFGVRPLHYGIAVLSSLAGLVASGRQVLLHIAPGNPGFGSPFMGLHFYTWALITFFALLAYCGVMLLTDRVDDRPQPRPLGFLARLAVLAFLAILAVNALSTTLECGLGPCPDNPTDYLWLRWL